MQKNKEKENIKDLILQKKTFYRLHQRMLHWLQHLRKVNKKVTEQTNIIETRKGIDGKHQCSKDRQLKNSQTLI